MGNRYWKANKEVSAKIRALMQQEQDVIDAAVKMSRKHGGSRERVYVSRGWARLYIRGFHFSDPAKADPKLFRQEKKTGIFIPRRTAKELYEEFSKLKSDAMLEVMKLLKLNLFEGNRCVTPGVNWESSTAYITTSDRVSKIPGCTRITDVAFEKATTRKRRPKLVAAK